MTKNPPNKLTFLIERDSVSGFTAHAVGESIITEADDIPALLFNIEDAVACHFPVPETRPKSIRIRRMY